MQSKESDDDSFYNMSYKDMHKANKKIKKHNNDHSSTKNVPKAYINAIINYINKEEIRKII